MDFSLQHLRDSAVLTTSYVGTKVIGDFRATTDNNSNFGIENQVNLLFNYTKGSLTSLEWKIEGAMELLFDLAYDGQSANFTVGETVTGGKSGATGVIVKDTDGGATGTLVIRMTNSGVDGKGFYDNEALTDSATGVAVVNGALNFQTATPSDTSFYQETFSSLTSGTDTVSLGEHTTTAATSKFFYSFSTKYPYVRVSVKGTGTTTSSLLALDAVIGQV